LNASELARNKFNSLFARHDAKHEPILDEQKSLPQTVKKEAKKTVKSN